MSSISSSVVSSSANNTSLLLSIPPNINPPEISITLRDRANELERYVEEAVLDGTVAVLPQYQAVVEAEDLDTERFNPAHYGINAADFDLDPAIFPLPLEANMRYVRDDHGLVEDLPIAEGQSKDQEKTLSEKMPVTGL